MAEQDAKDILEAPPEKNSAPVLAEFPGEKSAGPQGDMDTFLEENDADDALYGEGGDEDETPEAKAEVDDEPAQAESTAKDEPKDTDDDVSADDYERALQAIRRDGLDPDALRWGRKRLIEHGLTRAAAHDKESDSYRGLKEELNALKESSREAKESSGNATPADEPFALNGELEPFKAELGEESAKALEAVFKSQHERAIAREKLSNERIDRIERSALMGMYESARSRLQGRFPDLGKDETWLQVAQRAEVQVNGIEGMSIDSAIIDSSNALKLSDATEAARQEKDEKADAAKANGTPTGKSRRRKPTSAKTEDERDSDTLAELEEAHGWGDD